MRRLVVKLHIYAGLLTFSQLVLYGVAGIVASFQSSLERPKTPYDTRVVAYSAPANATDKEVAADVHRKLTLPLTRPIPDWFLQHTPEGNLQLDFYNINGIFRVIVLEREQRLRIESIRNSSGLFFEDMHAVTMSDREAPRLLLLWGVWNEFGLWSLLAFCASGVYLWLASRPGWLWAHAAWIASTVVFAAMYWSLR